MPRHTRFQAPPSQDPLGGAKTSLAFRLNLGFFFRQLGVFLMMDLLLLGMAVFGIFLYGETRCADVAALVEERGVPSAEALPWIEASDYTISLLDREPEGISLSLPWLTPRSETQQALRSYDLTSYYTVELVQDNIPYAITVSLSGIYRALCAPLDEHPALVAVSVTLAAAGVGVFEEVEGVARDGAVLHVDQTPVGLASVGILLHAVAVRVVAVEVAAHIEHVDSRAYPGDVEVDVDDRGLDHGEVASGGRRDIAGNGLHASLGQAEVAFAYEPVVEGLVVDFIGGGVYL